MEALSSSAFFMTVVVVSLYLMGNAFDFSEENQRLLISILRVLSVVAVGINSYALLTFIVWGVRHRHFLAARFMFTVFSLVLGVFFIVGTYMIDTLSGGF